MASHLPQRGRLALGKNWRRSLADQAAAELAEALADLLNAGLALDAALTVCASLSWPAHLTASIRRLAEQTRLGQLLSQALQRDALRWPPMLIAWTKVGEQTGQLAIALRHYHDTQRQWLLHQQRWWRSLSYPLLVLIVTIMAVVVMAHSLGDAQYPGSSPEQAAASVNLPADSLSVMDGLGLISLLFLLVALPLQRHHHQRQHGFRHRINHRADQDLVSPAWRPNHLQQLNNVAAVMTSLGLMLSSGLALSEALQQVKTGFAALLLPCPSLQNRLNALALDVTRGHSISKAFQQHQWPTPCLALARLAEHTGDLAQMFLQMGCLYRRRAERMQQRLEQWTAPCTLLLATAILVCAYQRYIAPLYNNMLGWQS